MEVDTRIKAVSLGRVIKIAAVDEHCYSFFHM